MVFFDDLSRISGLDFVFSVFVKIFRLSTLLSNVIHILFHSRVAFISNYS